MRQEENVLEMETFSKLFGNCMEVIGRLSCCLAGRSVADTSGALLSCWTAAFLKHKGVGVLNL